MTTTKKPGDKDRPDQDEKPRPDHELPEKDKPEFGRPKADQDLPPGKLRQPDASDADTDKRKARAAARDANPIYVRAAFPGGGAGAANIGWYNMRRRRPGDVFLLDKAEDFSEKWMEKISKDEYNEALGVRTPRHAPLAKKEMVDHQGRVYTDRPEEPFRPTGEADVIG